MTDDRVAGLPDAGTIQPGDPGHIETHDRMAELMQFAAERIGIVLDPPAPKPAVIGEYGHVDAHNTLLANIEQIAREAGTAVGGPPAPVLTNPEGGGVIAFTSGGEGVGGPTIAYGAEIEPNDHGETVTVEWDDPLVGGEVSVSGTQPFTDYIVTVYGVNVAGRGESATTDAFQLNYNSITGGTITHIDNYRDTGKRYQVHTYNNSTITIEVVQSPKDYEVLIVKPGAKGGQGGGGGARGGNGGQGTEYLQAKIEPGMRTITPSAGTIDGLSGTPTFTQNGGGGGAPAPGQYQLGGTGGAGYGSYVGTWPTEQRYGGGGGGGSNTIDGTHWGGHGKDGGGRGGHGGSPSGHGQRGGGGGGGCYSPDNGTGSTGGNGSAGLVIIAYEVAANTKQEIAQAKAEAAARETGYATGYDDGVIDGQQQQTEAIAETVNELREQVKEALPTKDKK